MIKIVFSNLSDGGDVLKREPPVAFRGLLPERDLGINISSHVFFGMWLMGSD